MPPDELQVVITAQWSAKADEDLELAAHLLKSNTPYYSAIAFHAQQAAEKYLKAILSHYRIAFPKTHDLAVLLDMLVAANSRAAGELDELTALTPFAVESRYPGDFPVVTQVDAARTVELVQRAATVAHAIVRV
jgi:HEPN domain-containing protein